MKKKEEIEQRLQLNAEVHTSEESEDEEEVILLWFYEKLSKDKDQTLQFNPKFANINSVLNMERKKVIKI